MSEFSVVDSVDGPGCSGASVLGYPGMLLWFSFCIYLFCGMFVLCEEYFIPALTVLSWKLGLSDDVSGGTLMALGTSTPELFTALIGVFLYSREDNPGPATNCASAAYNLCVIIGSSILFCGRSQLPLHYYAFIRDGIMYGLSVLLLHAFYEVWSPGKIELWESTILVLHYVLYCVILYYQPYVQPSVVKICDAIGLQWLSQRLSAGSEIGCPIKYAPGTVADSDHAYSIVSSGDSVSPDPVRHGLTSFIPQGASTGLSGSVSAAATTVTVTSPKNSGGINNKRSGDNRTHSNSANLSDDDILGMTFQGELIRSQSAGSGSSISNSNTINSSSTSGVEYGSAGGSGNANNSDDIRVGPVNPSASDMRDWHYWKSIFHKLMLPYHVIFEVTLVKTNCPKDLSSNDRSIHNNGLTIDSTATAAPIRHHNTALQHFDLDDPSSTNDSNLMMDDIESSSVLQLESDSLNARESLHNQETSSLFDNNDDGNVMSDMNTVLKTMFGVTVWLFILSYLAMDLANKIGVCLSINADVMGISLLAIGSSLPDTFSSVLVARQGKGSMAVSNAMGSNIFDICICVGLPFLLKSLFQNKCNPIKVESDPAYRLFLLALLFLLVFLAILLFKDGLILRPKHGWILIVAYAVYLLLFCNVLNRNDS